MERIELPEGYELSEKEAYMNPMHLEFFYRKLEEWKKSLGYASNQVSQLLEHASLSDPDLSDRVSEEAQARFELRKGSRYRKLISKIEAAMGRIERKEYGYCSSSGQAIGIERLKARPIATLSIEAQRKHELEEKHHKERRFSYSSLRITK